MFYVHFWHVKIHVFTVISTLTSKRILTVNTADMSLCCDSLSKVCQSEYLISTYSRRCLWCIIQMGIRSVDAINRWDREEVRKIQICLKFKYMASSKNSAGVLAFLMSVLCFPSFFLTSPPRVTMLHLSSKSLSSNSFKQPQTIVILLRSFLLVFLSPAFCLLLPFLF